MDCTKRSGESFCFDWRGREPLDLYQALGAHIRFHRRAQDLSQQALAALSNVPVEVIGKIERGTTTSTVDTVERIASALVLPPLALFGVGDLTADTEREKTLRCIANVLTRLTDDQVKQGAAMLENLADEKAPDVLAP